MIHIEIPDWKTVHLAHLVLDYNGTIARDGILLPGVAEMIVEFDAVVEVHVVTGNTFNTAERELARLPCRVIILPPEKQTRHKLEYVQKLGHRQCAAFGNGRNDRLMLKQVAVGVAVLGEEGAAVQAIASADAVVHNVLDAFSLLKDPYRLKALLRG